MHLVVFVCVIICLFKIIVQHDDMSCQFMYHLHPCYVAMCDSIGIPMNQHKLFMVFDKYRIPRDSQFWTTVTGVVLCCNNVSQVLSRSAETCAAKSTG